MSIKTNQVLIHLLCGIVFLLFPVLSSPDFPHIGMTLHNVNGLREVFTHALLIGFFYLNYAWLVPRFYFRQQYRSFYLLAFLFALFTILLIYGLSQLMGAGRAPYPGPPPMPPPGMHRPLHSNLLRMIFLDYNLYLFVIVFITAILLKTNERWRWLQKEQLQTELAYLKAQINPHFLFNTLNSIYALALEKSDYTATAVVKLSGMMRYLISESGKNFVSLQQELDYIRDYIELQQFRLGETAGISYQASGSARGYEIAPLILITFVENAFKYGVNPEQHSAIGISITIAEDSLTLTVQNNKVTISGAATASGLGIRNAQNRLQMLYADKHRLQIDEDAAQFRVTLELKLI
ncbi:sensor histidine kinase [Taibaiella chishuiensis]|uniref:Histidine kinase n=1 Tax=Taibaiella chishuiensis TaxID=1434707 RepID=A0A2P8DA26_9BACT|nr:sensor histidine kinase [Taibaiella chishuiensis]PSK94074.1 histidine kinase [Taibaiella chishuiensis]